MTNSRQEIQQYLDFQLSLLRLADIQTLTVLIPNSPAPEIAEHQALQKLIPA